MNSIDLAVNSLSISARTSRVKGLTVSQRAAQLGLDHLRPLRQQFVGRRIHRMGELDRVDVGRRIPGDVGRNAVELLEAVRSRQALRLTAEMPLSEYRRGVAEPWNISPMVKPAPRACFGAWNEDQRKAVADGILPGHQRRARGCAGRLDEELRQPQSFLGEFVDARRRRAAKFPAAVRPEVTVTDVVGEDEDDVRCFCLRERRDSDRLQCQRHRRHRQERGNASQHTKRPTSEHITYPRS